MDVYSVHDGDLLISTDRSLLDFGIMHAFLKTTYWTPDITLEQLHRQVENSTLAFGLYRIGAPSSTALGSVSRSSRLSPLPVAHQDRATDPAGFARPPGQNAEQGGREAEPREARTQLGFCRVVSDLTRFAYLGDVMVIESEQRRGLGQKLVAAAMQHPELRGVRKWLLATKDAHGVYAKLGFEPLPNPEAYMVLKPEDAQWV
jgi:GNAT superfamily N-acetyltransferase